MNVEEIVKSLVDGFKEPVYSELSGRQFRRHYPNSCQKTHYNRGQEGFGVLGWCGGKMVV